MTGTKIVKLRLEDGRKENLPGLRDVLSEPQAEELVRICGRINYDDAGKYYKLALAATKKYNLTSLELQTVVEGLEKSSSAGYESLNRSGIFLTALIQNSKQREFTIKTNKPLNCFGCSLSGHKSITVNGDLGHNAGLDMINGTIHVYGKTGNSTGNSMDGGAIIVEEYMGSNTGFMMSGGTIICHGSSGSRTGHAMACRRGMTSRIEIRKDAGDGTGFMMSSGAEIEIGGNAGDGLGEDMHGGVIRVKGKIGSISPKFGSGEIWEGDVKKRPEK
ncbi:MAG: hypothetical protein V1921_06625 [Candidatus Altiarchaeota archaeon]